jgi:Transposase DDE domain group 1
MDGELRFSDKEITAWGGMGVMKRMLDHLGFDSALSAAGLPQPGSNRGYRPEQLITQFMLSVWCGANRFEHGEVTRHDPVLKRLFGFKRMANFKAVMRLFNKFGQATNESVMDSLYRWMFGQLSINGLTLDLDSTVMTRYGTQEGAACGYNPAKRGRASHHPLMAFIADTRMIANCWLRPGNANGWWVLQDEQGKCVDGIELTRFRYQAPAWSQPRWVIGIRQHIEKRAAPKGKTLNLFADDPVIGQWRFSALVTDLDLPAEVIWRTYRGRADCENRLKELKYDFAADSFNMRDFWATEAALNTVCFRTT